MKRTLLLTTVMLFSGAVWAGGFAAPIVIQVAVMSGGGLDLKEAATPKEKPTDCGSGQGGGKDCTPGVASPSVSVDTGK